MARDSNPSHVRLPERLTVGMLADLDSGWVIGGNDVKPFPDAAKNPVAANFVKDKLRQGHLEPASAEEHKVVEDSRKQMSEAHLQHLDEREAHDRYGHQEAALQDIGVDTRAKLKELRDAESHDDDEDGYEEPEVGSMQSSGGADGPQDQTVTPTGSTATRRTRG